LFFLDDFFKHQSSAVNDVEVVTSEEITHTTSGTCQLMQVHTKINLFTTPLKSELKSTNTIP